MPDSSSPVSDSSATDGVAATIACDAVLAGRPPGPLLTLAAADGQTVVRLALRAAGADPAEREWDDVRQNYLRWAGPDGTAMVLEAWVAIAPDAGMRATVPTHARLGVPLALLPGGRVAIRLRLRPGKAELLVDGRLVDEDWPCGGLAAPPLAIDGAQVWPRALDDAELGLLPEDGVTAGSIPGSAIQYWTPPGHNRWLGDTMMLQDEGRLRLMYLIDRRHHGSKGGAGAHQIAHLSTTDLTRWDAHPLVAAVERPWEVIGTGGAVRHGGRLHVLYGLHTDRVVERTNTEWGQRTALPCAFSALPGLALGATTAVSDDGTTFTKQEELVHPAQNPSVFVHPDGGFALFAGYGAEGLFRSDDLRHWRLADPAIIPSGADAPLRNSSECICHFAWNGWHYLLGGRTGMWLARDFAGPYWDHDGQTAPTLRWDVYDGLWVPMVAALADGRRILSGWLEDRGGWAGCLVLRELLQEADGTLSLRWPAEVVPPTLAPAEVGWTGGTPTQIAAGTRSAADGLPDSYLLELTVNAAPGAALAVVVGGSGDLEDGCELRIEPSRQRAQWGTPADGAPAPEVPDQAAIFATDDGKLPIFRQTNPHLPFKGGDFALTAIAGLDRPFTVRLLVLRDAKSGSTIVDAELAGRRTMVSRRHGLRGNRLHLLALGGAVKVSGLSVRPLAPR